MDGGGAGHESCVEHAGGCYRRYAFDIFAPVIGSDGTFVRVACGPAWFVLIRSMQAEEYAPLHDNVHSLTCLPLQRVQSCVADLSCCFLDHCLLARFFRCVPFFGSSNALPCHLRNMSSLEGLQPMGAREEKQF